MIIFVGGAAFSVTRLDGVEWGVSIVTGFLVIPWGMILRLIPDSFIRMIVPQALIKALNGAYAMPRIRKHVKFWPFYPFLRRSHAEHEVQEQQQVQDNQQQHIPNLEFPEEPGQAGQEPRTQSSKQPNFNSVY